MPSSAFTGLITIRNQAILVVVGDITPEVIAQNVLPRLAAWPLAEVPERPFP